MTDTQQQKGPHVNGDRAGTEQEGAPEDGGRSRLAEAISLLKEAIFEARERGDLSAGRAKEALAGAAERARHATTEARERFDFVAQGEFDALARRVAALEAQVTGTSEEGSQSGEGNG